MEYSSNMLDLHHHHHPEELLLLHASSTFNWNYPHHLLNGGEVVIHSNDTNLSNSGNNEHLIDPSFASSLMVEDLGLQWTGHDHHPAHQQHLAKIKHEEQITLLHELSSSYSSSRGFFDPLSFGMFLPGALNTRSSLFMQQPLQPLITPCHASSNIHGSPFFDGSIDYGIQHHLQCVGQGGGCDLALHEAQSLKMPPSDLSGVAVNKSSSSCSSSMDQLKPSKRPRLESRPSLSPFKVRKEKLGDRIAALQQLVAPFGKTDTASVLTEAVGYIKFLQDQVETLSVAYMGPSNNKKLCTTEEVSADEREETKPNLRTRGLCLVPLSCTSYITGDNIVWSPPNYR